MSLSLEYFAGPATKSNTCHPERRRAAPKLKDTHRYQGENKEGRPKAASYMLNDVRCDLPPKTRTHFEHMSNSFTRQHQEIAFLTGSSTGTSMNEDVNLKLR
jgi:hypothetical protein